MILLCWKCLLTQHLNEIFYNWIFKKGQITNYTVQKISKDVILTLNINLVVVFFIFITIKTINQN